MLKKRREEGKKKKKERNFGEGGVVGVVVIRTHVHDGYVGWKWGPQRAMHE